MLDSLRTLNTSLRPTISLEGHQLAKRAPSQATRISVSAARAAQHDHAESARRVVHQLRSVAGQIAGVPHRGRVGPPKHLRAKAITEVERWMRRDRHGIAHGERAGTQHAVRAKT